MTTNQRHERGAAPKKGTSILLACLIGLSLACSLPGLFTRATPTPAAQGSLIPSPAAATPTPQPAPPAIVEVQPPPGEELPLDGAITLYFNQPMDSASVEAAISSEPSLPARLTWSDAATLVVQPGARLAPESELTVNIDAQARSASGLAMMQAASLKFRTVGALRLAQALPRDQAEQVDPTSAVAAAFNRPVVSLGAEPASQPPAFTVLAEDGSTASGRGEWSNTSTYIFYPQPALEGGKRYRVALNIDLQGVGGSPLEEASEWSFTTAPPQLLAIQPAGGDQRVRLDAPVVMTFNQPMDQASVEVNFRLLDSRSNAIPGNFTWDEAGEVVTYTAERLLERNQTYTLALDGRSLARGGTPLGETQRFQVRSVPPLAILGSDPQTGGMKPVYGPVLVTLSAPVPEGEFMKYVRLDPPVDDLSGWQDSEQGVLNLYGNLAPDTEYTLSISADLSDLWGGKLGRDFKLNFRTRPLDPSLMINGGSSVLYLTPADSTLSAQVVNVSRLNLALGEVSLTDFMALLGPEGYSLRQSLRPAADRAWVQPIESTPNRNQVVQVGLTPEGGSLAAGLYALRASIDPLTTESNLTLLVVSRAHLTYKLSPTQAMVWAVDLERDAPLAGAPVTIYDQTGTVLADGQTDSEGVFRDEIPTLSNPYEATYAVLGAPGDENFGLAMATWNMGTSAWDFDLPTSFNPPRLQAYLYTDRPIYRPGQTVYFRGVLRQAYNGRYKLPEAAQSKQAFSLALTTGEGQQVSAFDLPVSALGTFHGEAVLPADAAPGVYRLASKEEGVGEVYFQVADYRKPEINLQVGFEAGDAVAGESLTGQVNARYFFDAPAGNVKVHWGLYAATEPFSLPDYQVGVEEASWLETFNMPRLRTGLGELLAEGEATTAPDGTLELALPAQEAENRRRLTLEVTATDESGLPVSGRGQMALHPAAFYIGLRPDSWVGRAGESASFAVRTVDWEQEPASVKSLRAVFQKVAWEEQEPAAQGPDLGPTYVPKYTPVGSTDFVTSQDGEARLAFTPPQPGVYQLEVSGGGARSQLYLWVGGEGEAIWPNLPNQRIRLTADREHYQPGDTAQVFIPNPFGEGALALLTVERGEVLRHQLLRLEAGGSTLSLPLSSEEAPNVYLAVTLLGKTQDGRPDFRQGYLQVKVEPVEQVLNVALTRQPERAGPGDEVTFEIEVRDAAGQPVQGEFSLAMVDLAALALADPNSADIVSAYYGEQPLGVQTGLDMAVYANRLVFLPGGLGGGGGEAITSVTRENFPDTAYWNAQVVTDEQGRASLSVQLPDTLTTWQATLRGLTADSRVGEAVTQVVTSKELLVRPATPRFLVAGDHVQLAAVVQNNTDDALQVTVSLQAIGVSLDESEPATQQVDLPAGGRGRVTWWGRVQHVESADLVFSATAGDLQDAARPALGNLPVLQYAAPQTFSTAGSLEQGGQRLELISLPRSFEATAGGELRLELNSSLAAAMFTALSVLEQYPYACTEQVLSRFLPNLETALALKQLDVQSPELEARLEHTTERGLTQLLARQGGDGGWGWWQGDESDAYMTAYVLFGLLEAQKAGMAVSEASLQKAIEYLRAGMVAPGMVAQPWQLNRLAFVHFALARAGQGDLAGATSLYEQRDRLNPWAKALLALTLESLAPGSPPADTLFSDLESSAIRSATGAHWEDEFPDWQNMSSPVSTSAMVAYALAQSQPDAPLLSEAARSLVAHRQANGAWDSTYSTAWVIMALSAMLKDSGELSSAYDFSATLNGALLAGGQAGGVNSLAPVSADVPLSSLYGDAPNSLVIQRGGGEGRLYYRAALIAYLPVESVAATRRGVALSRAYFPLGEACPEGRCAAIQEGQSGRLVQARLALTLEQDAYYLVVEDYLPAGAEILDVSLKTSQQGAELEETPAPYDPRRPFANGWGWWLFSEPQVYDERIAWAVDYLPAGTYELTYTLALVQPGEFRVLPARAWQFYFPEVRGESAGAVFAIRP